MDHVSVMRREERMSTQQEEEGTGVGEDFTSKPVLLSPNPGTPGSY